MAGMHLLLGMQVCSVSLGSSLASAGTLTPSWLQDFSME